MQPRELAETEMGLIVLRLKALQWPRRDRGRRSYGRRHRSDRLTEEQEQKIEELRETVSDYTDRLLTLHRVFGISPSRSDLYDISCAIRPGIRASGQGDPECIDGMVECQCGDCGNEHEHECDECQGEGCDSAFSIPGAPNATERVRFLMSPHRDPTPVELLAMH